MQTSVLQQSRSDHTVRKLRRDITHGTLVPGTLLAEAAVARQLGVSRVPVREALFTLEREGLVQFSATGRAYVKELVPHDFEELFLLRLSLEPPAARLAAPFLRANPQALAENIEATARAKTLLDVTHLDLNFHEIMMEASGHTRMIRIWRSLRSEMELWLARMHSALEMQTRSTRQATVDAHAKTLECIKNESPAAVERFCRHHILGWRDWLPAAKPDGRIETHA
jgi:DNA-binding GntR family transcriptional regulator